MLNNNDNRNNNNNALLWSPRFTAEEILQGILRNGSGGGCLL